MHPVVDSPVPDAELLSRYAAHRDAAAFELLVWRHGRLVWGVCRRQLADRHAAEDAFQVAFLALARHAGRVRANLPGWLHRVAVRACHDLRQRPLRALPADLPTTDEHPERRELVHLLDEAVAALPERLRVPFVLCELGGRSNAAAAAALGCPVGTVESRLTRARAKLRDWLTRRGVTPTAVGVVAVPPAVQASAVRTALGVADPRLVALAGRAVRTGVTAKLVAAAVGVGAIGLALAGGRPPAADQPPPPEVRAAEPDGDQLPPGALARLGNPAFRTPGQITTVGYSPDGGTVFALVEVGVRGQEIPGPLVYAWDAASGRLRFHTEQPPAGQMAGVRHCVGEPLALLRATDGSKRAEVRRFDMTTRRWSDPLAPAPYFSTAFVASADASAAVVEIGYADGARILDLKTGTADRPFPNVGDRASHPTLSADGRRMAVNAGNRNVLIVFDARTGAEVVRRPIGPDDPAGATFNGVALSPDGGTLVARLACPPKSSPPARLVFRDLATGRERALDLDQPSDGTLSLSADGKRVALFLKSGDLIVIDTARPAVASRVPRAVFYPGDSYPPPAFAPDGRSVAVAALSTVAVYDAATGTRRMAADPTGVYSQLRWDAPDRLTTTPGRFVTTESDTRLVTFDTDTGRVVTERSAGVWSWPATPPAFAADGRRAAVIRDGRVWLRGVGPGADEQPLDPVPQLSAVAFTPDGGRVVAATRTGTLRVWDAGTRRELLAIPGAGGPIDRLAVTSDGTRVVAGFTGQWAAQTDSTIRVWDLSTGRGVQAIRLPGGPNMAAEFVLDPTDHYLAAALRGRAIDMQLLRGDRPADAPPFLLFDLSTGRAIRVPAWPDGPATPLAFGPGGRTLAVADQRGGLHLWETATGRPLARVGRHAAEVKAAAFRPDGRRLAAASVDAPILLWDVFAPLPHDPKLSTAEAWAKLADPTPAAAFPAMVSLVADPAAATLFGEKLTPVPAADGEKVAGLIRDLDSPAFAARDAAKKGLEAVADAARPQLAAAVAGTPSAEARQALEAILRANRPVPAELLRQIRGVEVLTAIGTPEARAVLAKLAAGAPGARLTVEAGGR